MKKIIVAALFVAGMSGAAFAQTSGDLILGFRATGGTGSTTNLEVDLGNYNAFELSSLGGTYAGGQETLLNLGSLLTSDYGANWNTRSDVLWGVAGALSAGSSAGPDGAVAKTIFATSDANSSVLDGNQSASILYNSGTATQQGTPAAKITGVYQNMGLGNPIVSADATAGNSWSSEVGATPVAFQWFNKGAFDNTAAPQNAGGYSAGDFFELKPSTGNGTFFGTFALASNGDVTFTAVPEPSTYAAILGALVLGVVLIRRRQQIAA